MLLCVASVHPENEGHKEEGLYMLSFVHKAIIIIR